MGEHTTTPQPKRAYMRYNVKQGDMVYPIHNEDPLPDSPTRYPPGILLKIEDSGGGPEVCPYVQFHLFVEGRGEVYDEPYWSIAKVFRAEEEV